MVDIEAGGGSPAPSNPRQLRDIKEQTPLEIVAGIVASIAIATSLAAIVVTQGASTVIPAAILSCVAGPYMYYQQTQLTDIKVLEETYAAAKREVTRLTEENERLAGSIEDLTGTVDRLEENQEALDSITKIKGQNVDIFLEQVEQNREILRKMEVFHQNNVLQNIIAVVMSVDDGDMTINENEARDVLKRIKSINGVQVDELKFLSIVKGSGGNVHAIVNVIKKLIIDEADNSPSKVFSIDESAAE